MQRRSAIWTTVALVTLGGLVAELGKAQAIQPRESAVPANDCDRKCLYGFVDIYLDGLVKKDASRVPWAKKVMFTENNVALRIGDGLWGTISGRTNYDLRAADTSTGQVAFFGIVEEHGVPSFLAMRLKVEDHRISEVETLIDRKGNGPGPFGDPSSLAAVPILSEDVPLDERTPRARMISLADGYFSTLQLNDGQLFTQFTPDCSRRENGVWTASDPHPDPQSTYSAFGKYSCEEGFKLGNYRWDDRLRDRRFPLVDEEKGIVLAAAFIDHSGRLETYTTTDGVAHTSPIKSPHSFCALEMFKIIGGKIRHAESVFITVPYNMPSPWMPHPR